MAATDGSTPRHPIAPTSAVVYLLFHEHSTEAAEVASAVYDRLRHPDEDVWRSRVGIPVFVRCCAAPREPTELMPGTEAGLVVGNQQVAALRLRAIPLPTPGLTAEQARGLPERTFVVPLVCDHMAADPRWRLALEELAKAVKKASSNPATQPRAVLMPVLLGAAGPGVVGLPDDGQVISAFHWTDGAAGPARAEVRRARVLRELFLWMIREMRACIRGATDAGDAPVEVFLSHAKADREDGPRVAERLRDTIAGMGHVRGWYDENDLLPGAAWRRLLARAAGGTAAMLVVWSSRYASRPWCRRELSEARRLRPAGTGDEGNEVIETLSGGEVLSSVPVVVVDTLSVAGEVTRVPPELATLPTVRWDVSHAAHAVDMAIHEALMGLSNTLQARAILRQVAERGPRVAPVVAVTAPPDHSSVSELVRAGARAVLHPGYGLSLSEQAEIEARFRGGEAVRLVRYDEWEQLVQPTSPPARPQTVQISAGGAGDGLGERGMLPEHFAELIYELVHTCLGAGADLVYAGKPGYLQVDLVDLIAAAAAEHESTRGGGGGTRVRFFTPWRPSGGITAGEQARHLPACRFEDVFPVRGVGEREPSKILRLRAELEATPELHVWNEALARSEARRLCAEQADTVVLAGGKRTGWGGVMPGLLEELTNACESSRCRNIVLLSGFGGSAAWMAGLIRDPARIATEVTIDAHLDSAAPFRTLLRSLGADRVMIEARWAAARAALRALAGRRVSGGESPPGPGRGVGSGATPLSERLRVHLIDTDSLRGIRRELRRCLQEES